MFFLRQGATHKVLIGPVVAVGDGFTPVTTLALSTADEAEALVHDSATVVDLAAYTWAAVTTADGYYVLTLQSGITGTVGHMTVLINDDSLCLPVKAEFTVLEEAVYDAFYAASATGVPALAALEASVQTVDTVVDGIQTDLSNGTDGLGAIKAETALILTDTGTTLDGKINTIGTDTAATQVLAAGATGFAAIDTVVDGIQTDLSNATDGLGAIKAETALILTDTTLIVADTNELQTDWVDGGRLDLILDSAASAGDPWSTALPGAYGAGTAGEIIGDWKNGERLDLILDIIAADTTTDIPALIATAQADLDTLTGTDGATLATAQGNYAPAKAGDSMDMSSISGDSAAADALETAFDGTAGPVPELGIVDQGTAQSATGTTLVLRAAAAFADSVLNDATIVITGGSAGVGQRRAITAYDSATDTATVDAWDETPAGTITYKIFGSAPASSSTPAPVNVTQWNGTAVATPTTAGVPEVDVTFVSGTAQTAGDLAALLVTADAAIDVAVADLANATDGLGAIKAETALIVADTNELQTDWADGGRLDLLLDGAASAGDPWTTTLPGAYGAGTAGKIIGDNIDAPISTVDTVVDGIQTDLSNATDGLGAIKADTAAILVDTAEIGAAGAGLTAINLPNQTMDIVGNITGNLSGSVGSVTGAVGSVTGHTAQTGDTFALANGVTGFVAIDTVVDAVKAKTDQMVFTKANEIDANTQSLNGATLAGDGSATPWGP